MLSPVTAPLLGARTHSSAHILFLAPLGLWGSARPCRASASQSRRLCLAVPASCSQPGSGVPLALVMRMAFPRPETDFGTPGPSFIGSRSSCPPRPPELRDHSQDRRGRWREGRKPGVESWPAARSGLHGETAATLKENPNIWPGVLLLLFFLKFYSQPPHRLATHTAHERVCSGL